MLTLSTIQFIGELLADPIPRGDGTRTVCRLLQTRYTSAKLNERCRMWINAHFRDRQAEWVSHFFRKGDAMLVVGDLRQTQGKDANGGTVLYTYIDGRQVDWARPPRDKAEHNRRSEALKRRFGRDAPTRAVRMELPNFSPWDDLPPEVRQLLDGGDEAAPAGSAGSTDATGEHSDSNG